MALAKAARLALGAVAALAAVALPARAHDETVSTTDVVIEERAVVLRIDVGTAGLAKALGRPIGAAELELAAVRAEIARVLAGGVEVRVGSAVLAAAAGRLEPREEPLPSGAPALARVVQELRFASADPIDRVVLKLALFAALTTQHRALVKVRWGDERRQFTRLGVSELVLVRGQLFPSALNTAREFLFWGAQHIFLGFDHIAFLLALLLAITRLGELLKVVTSFTVAHSITLLLAAFGVLSFPSRLTEALIAASIVYVAVENLIFAGRPLRHRWLLTFGFGLVHGLGFATQLRDRLSELEGGVALPVLTFNLGVELGQVAILCLAFPLLERARRLHPDPPRLIRLASTPILALGLYWLWTRLN